jgi:hypothetical protein
MIGFQRKALKLDREVRPDDVYDFTMMRVLKEELKKSK